MPFSRVNAVKNGCYSTLSAESIVAEFPANMFSERAKIEGVTGDGDGDISRQSKAFYCDFVACELYVKRAVIELLVLLCFAVLVFFLHD